MSRRLLFTVALALLGAARASDLAVYYNFAEVREAVQVNGDHFDWSPPGDTANALVPGSLALEYPGVLSLTALGAQGNLLAAFEGKQVLVRRDGQQVSARVVDADRALFEANGQFFHADPSSVTYPSLDGVRLNPTFSWALQGPGGAATLTYLTRALTWSPRYTLAVKAQGAALDAWADVRNAAALAYTAPSLELIAGQVNLNGGPRPEFLEAPTATAGAAKLDRVQAAGEASGLQLFRFDKPVVLPAQSVTSWPFITPSITLDRTLEYNSYFTPVARLVAPLQRTYTVKADADLPAGTVTVREDDRVVGQAGIGDTPKGEAATLSLGQDFDLRLTRTAQQLERTRAQARYRVSFSLTNTKSRPVMVRIHEVLQNYAPSFTIDAAVLPNLKKDAEGFTATATLAAGARLEASYTITFRYPQQP